MRAARLGDIAEIERDGIAPDKIVAGTAYLGLEHIESGGRIISSVPVANGELASTKFQLDTSKNPWCLRPVRDSMPERDSGGSDGWTAGFLRSFDPI